MYQSFFKTENQCRQSQYQIYRHNYLVTASSRQLTDVTIDHRRGRRFFCSQLTKFFIFSQSSKVKLLMLLTLKLRMYIFYTDASRSDNWISVDLADTQVLKRSLIAIEDWVLLGV